MSSKKVLLILVMAGLMVTTATAQKRQVIVQKTTKPGDQPVMIELDCDHDVDLEVCDSSHPSIIFKKEFIEMDSLMQGLKMGTEPSLKNVFIHKMPHLEKRIARIVIKKSGFFRKNKIVIDFDPFTRDILKVVDNDKDISPNKFHKYQDYLEDATELSELEALHPAMEEFDLQIELGELPNFEVLEGLDSMIIKLDGLKSKHAVVKKHHYKSMKQIVELENLAEEFQDILTGAGLTPPQKINDIAIKKRKFYINGEEIEGEVGRKCIVAYINHSDLTLEDLEKKGEEISIQIKFD